MRKETLNRAISKGHLNKTALVLFLGIIMISSTFSMSSSNALPQNLPDVSQAPFKVRVIEGNGFIAFLKPMLTVSDDPALHLTVNAHDGVAKLDLIRSDFPGRVIGCSGALLTATHVLTAAHCVSNGVNSPDVLISGTVTFDGVPSIAIVVAETAVHGEWDGSFLRGNDIAVLKLASPAPDEITRYDIDRDGSNDVSSVVEKVGYGVSGLGDDGWDVCIENDPCQDGDTLVYPFGEKRNGLNKYDDIHDTMWDAIGFTPNADYKPGAVLQFDFDNGKRSNDAFGFFFKNSDRGLGDDEVDSAPGDSGGIGITNGVITGVTSYGVTLASCNPFGVCNRTSDVNDDIDSSFGEFAGDTRVSKYYSFIDGVTEVIPLDDIPPDTSIDSMPTDPSNDSTPTFGFSGTDVGSGVASFDCDLDGGGSFSDIDCTSPKMLVPLADGSHTFQVRAIDNDGNVDPSPASYTWTVDSTAPPSVTVSTILPSEIHKGQTSFTVTITGSGFQEDASVTFVNGCGPSPSASTVSVEDTIIIADIATKNAGPPGSCIFNVRVTNTDSSTGVGAEFTVLP